MAFCRNGNRFMEWALPLTERLESVKEPNFIVEIYNYQKMQRKDFIKLTLTGCATFFLDFNAFPALFGSRGPAQELNKTGRFDLHHHFFPPVAKKRYGPFPPIQDYSPAKAVEEMDEAGVETAFLSLPSRLGDDPVTIREEAIGFAREANEYAAKVASDYKGRFGFFAFLPLPDIDASLQEIEYAFDTLRADGVGLLTSYGNHWLGDAAFQPVFDELNRRHAIVYSHPTDGPCCHNLLSNTIPHTVEWNTDTSRAIWSLINDGTDRPPVTTPGPSMATRYANITFVWSHGGGTLLGFIGRFLGQGSTRNVDLSQTPAPNSKLYHLRRFYYDTALSANRIQMQALRELVGSSQIVFGSDFPFMPILDTVEGLQRCGLNLEELRAIGRDNALKMLPARKSH
jgi:6-methylsalicylate decarboxylase